MRANSPALPAVVLALGLSVWAFAQGKAPAASGGGGGDTPHYLPAVEIGEAGDSVIIGGLVLPSDQAIAVRAAVFRIIYAGTGGSDDMTFRITDGTNNCDASLPCNAAVDTNYRVSTTGSCVFAASASLTMLVQSAGACQASGAQMVNFSFEGVWQ